MRLAFLHAFPLDHSMWDEQLTIAPGCCSAPRLYHLGDSLESWAQGALDSLEPGPMIAIGSSMGGSCAIEMARQAPRRIAALVLVGTKAGHRPEPDARDSYIEALHAHGINGMWPQLVSLLGPTAPPSVIDKVRAIAFAQDTDDLINAVRVFHGRSDLTAVVTQWKKPLLVVCGDADPLVTVQKATALSEAAPNAKLHVMSGCGHVVNMERPDEFNHVLAAFVRSVNATHAR